MNNSLKVLLLGYILFKFYIGVIDEFTPQKEVSTSSPTHCAQLPSSPTNTKEKIK